MMSRFLLRKVIVVSRRMVKMRIAMEMGVESELETSRLKKALTTKVGFSWRIWRYNFLAVAS